MLPTTASRIELEREADYAIVVEPGQLSSLDNLIQRSWQQKMDAGFFRYPFQHPQCKVIPGAKGYLAQLNPFRVSGRRLPQAMMSVKQAFDHEKFNFNQVDADKEVLFRAAGDNEGDICIINVSPIEFAHCLFLPQVAQCLPQALDRHAILSALKLMLLSRATAFKMAFNSLCAYASVNHLHWHLYYLQPGFEVPTAFVKGCALVEDLLYELHDYSAKGFAFELKKVEDLEAIAENIFKVVHYLYDREVAHNVFITRGRSLSALSEEQVIRIIIWPRQSIKGHKQPDDFCIAVCELAGQMLIYNQEAYQDITEERVQQAHQQTCSAVFESLKPSILRLFENKS